jgi:acetoin utilization deacetylase AcuC-like enzyme
MRVVASAKHRVLDPPNEVAHGQVAPASDVPARVDVILDALKLAPWVDVSAPRQHGMEPIGRLHDRDLVRFLETAWDEWVATGATGPLFPDTIMHAGLRPEAGPTPEPTDIGARMGYWCFETFTPIVEGTYVAALAAVDVGLTGADILMEGERAVYALCRPPGHHAGARIFGGSSYLNNAAIAVEHLHRATGERVAVLDVDLHHGNGTQALFYERDDVLYVSLHGDPRNEYPYFSGFADERGAGPGEGFNRNFPMPAHCGDEAYVGAVAEALEAVSNFGAPFLVVSLGLDTYRLDGDGGLDLTKDAYDRVGAMVGSLGLSTLIVQEGGYYLPDLGENVRRWLHGVHRQTMGPEDRAPKMPATESSRLG